MENWRTKKKTNKNPTKINIQIPGDQDTGMARPDTREIGGLKKKERKKRFQVLKKLEKQKKQKKERKKERHQKIN